MAPFRKSLLIAVMIIGTVVLQEASGGPHKCADRIRNHWATKMTEFPPKGSDKTNFASFGEKCSPTLQSEFEMTMHKTFTRAIADDVDNKDVMQRLDETWNDWRGVTETKDGEDSGGICNPKWSLSCEPVNKTCSCRQDFELPGSDTQHENHKKIRLQPEQQELDDPSTGMTKMVTVCKAAFKSSCIWEAPWLSFCTFGCVKGHECAATPGKEWDAICVPCDLSTEDGLDECIMAVVQASNSFDVSMLD